LVSPELKLCQNDVAPRIEMHPLFPLVICNNPDRQKKFLSQNPYFMLYFMLCLPAYSPVARCIFPLVLGIERIN